MTFMDVAYVLDEIASTSSTLAKQQILREHSDDEDLKAVLKFIYDPYFTTGIGEKKLDRVMEDPQGLLYAYTDIIEYLRENNTGRDCDAAIAKGFIYSVPNPIWEWAAQGLVTQNLQIGVSVTTLNTVFGKGFIPVIGIMRGTLCPEDVSGIYIATEKIDGNRRLIMNKPTGVEIYTRSGKRDYGLVELEEQAKQLPVGYVFDCECIAIGDFADSIELRQASASVLNSRTKEKRNVMACAFDVLTQQEYDEGKSRLSALGRKMRLAAMFGDTESCNKLIKYFEEYDEKHNTALSASLCVLQRATPTVKLKNMMALPILGIVHNKPEAIELAKPIWETGGEGVMLVEYMSPYEVNPNPRKTLLKIKATKEYTLECVGVFEGRNKYEGMLGGITLMYKASDGNLYRVDCGSGFADYERVEYWQNPHKIVGKFVEIDSFGESRNANGDYSLNCPIFKRIVGAKE